MKKTVWNIPPVRPIPEELLRAGYSPLLSSILVARGITTAAGAGEYLACSPDALNDPFALAGMDAAIARIRAAQERQETVAVYGDYDVDGITAACLLTEYLRGTGLKTEIYIPDRPEGYGLNNNAIDNLRGKGVSLIVTVDTGITAVQETAYAASLGIDMVITDHHECQAQLPEAAAVVDPKQPGCGYPDRNLAGVGVAFKLVCALSGDPAAMLRRYADLVAMGTVADVMPLIGENRYMVSEGLRKLRRSPCPGLAALIEENGVNRDAMSASTISYKLAPCINAAGRLFHVAESAELVLEQDPVRAAELARDLCSINRDRRQLEADIMAQAGELLAGAHPTAPIVLARDGWHQGVIGIAASRLVDRYQTPAIMISLDGDRGKGSCRSCGDFDLFAALTACRELLTTFGGHSEAAGLTIERKNIDAFRDAIGRYYAEHPSEHIPALRPDVLVEDPAWLNLAGTESLEQLEPCGTANPRPLFCMTDARIVSLSSVGGGAHAKLQIEKNGTVFDCIWFGQRAEDLAIFPGCRADVAFDPSVNEFRGRRTVQLQIKAMRWDDGAPWRGILSGLDGHGCRISRDELGVLWRALERRCPARIAYDELPDTAPPLRPGQIALGLRVLSELSLAALDADESGVTVTLPDHPGRAELHTSAAWQRHHR